MNEEKEKSSKQSSKTVNNGFTLIELLVVVLIIGILAAIALPQYKKVVEKANAAEALPLLKAVWQAEQSYYLLHNTYATQFNALDVDIPPSYTGNVKWRNNSYVMRDTVSNAKWSLQIYSEEGYGAAIYLGRISGKYKGAGFQINCAPIMTIDCAERVDNGIIFNGNDGDYCEKIFNAAKDYEDWNIRTYLMP